MFTGLVIDVGSVRSIQEAGDTRFEIACGLPMEKVSLGASICCSGVCLTVVDKGDDWFAADVSAASLAVTTLGDWQTGGLVNLEPSLRLGDEMGGHIVTGHVDVVGEITDFSPTGDSITMQITVPRSFAHLVAAKGSVAIDGVSLTVNAVEDKPDSVAFSINLIPHTQEVTAFRAAAVGSKVNVEFDILARYVARLGSVSAE